MKEEEESLCRPRSKENLSGAGREEAVGFRMEHNIRMQDLRGNPRDNTTARGSCTLYSITMAA